MSLTKYNKRVAEFLIALVNFYESFYPANINSKLVSYVSIALIGVLIS